MVILLAYLSMVEDSSRFYSYYRHALSLIKFRGAEPMGLLSAAEVIGEIDKTKFLSIGAKILSDGKGPEESKGGNMKVLIFDKDCPLIKKQGRAKLHKHTWYLTIFITPNHKSHTMIEESLVLEKNKKRDYGVHAQLVCNLVSHVTHIKMVKASEEDKKCLTETYGKSLSMIPVIYITDPIAIWYGIKVGEIWMVERPSDTAGVGSAFRRVIK